MCITNLFGIYFDLFVACNSDGQKEAICYMLYATKVTPQQ